MTGRTVSALTQPAQGDRAGSSYARPHPAGPSAPVADPGANRLDWYAQIRPVAAVAVPDGFAAVQMANSGRTSAGLHNPGALLALPHDEARELTRQGLAREVLCL